MSSDLETHFGRYHSERATSRLSLDRNPNLNSLCDGPTDYAGTAIGNSSLSEYLLLDVRLSVFFLLTAKELLRHVSDACSLSLVLYTKYLFFSVCIDCLDVMMSVTSPQHMTAT